MSARQSALALMIIFALFGGAVTVRLVAMRQHEARAGVLNDKFKDVTKQAIDTVEADKFIHAYRDHDRIIRQNYFRTRRQNEIAGYLIASAVIGFMLSARWFVSEGQKQPRRRVRLTDAEFAARERKEAVAVGAAVILLFAGLSMLSPRERAQKTVGDAVKPVAAPTVSRFKENWPNLRGPNNLGVAAAGDWPTSWSAATNAHIGWKTAIPHAGKSSPVVWGDFIFLTGGDEAAQHVMCFSRVDGKLVWDKAIASPPEARELSVSPDAGFAASTAATDGERVYAIFPTGMLVAFDFDGKQAWTKNLGVPDTQYGVASSLIVHEGTLIVQLDQGATGKENKSRLIGIDGASGQERWSTPRDVPSSWATPALIRAGRLELITCAQPFVIAYDPVSGKELWRVKALSGDIVSSAAFDGERVIITADRTLAIKPGGAGDVTKTHVVWKNIDALGDIASPVSDGKRDVMIYSAGTIYCVDAADGELVWEKALECGVTASPVLAGQSVYVFGEDGVARIFKPGDAYQLDAQGDVGEPIRVTPAFADGQIYIRGEKNLFCIRK